MILLKDLNSTYVDLKRCIDKVSMLNTFTFCSPYLTQPIQELTEPIQQLIEPIQQLTQQLTQPIESDIGSSMYTFSLNPEYFQPSGIVNFSRLTVNFSRLTA